jgi:hypothetical protein
VRPARYYRVAGPGRTARRLVVVVRPVGDVPPEKVSSIARMAAISTAPVADADLDRRHIRSVSSRPGLGLRERTWGNQGPILPSGRVRRCRARGRIRVVPKGVFPYASVPSARSGGGGRDERWARAAGDRGTIRPDGSRRPVRPDRGSDRRARPGEARPDRHPAEGRLAAADRGEAAPRSAGRRGCRPGGHRRDHRQGRPDRRRRARQPQGGRAGVQDRARQAHLKRARPGRGRGGTGGRHRGGQPGLGGQRGRRGARGRRGPPGSR